MRSPYVPPFSLALREGDVGGRDRLFGSQSQPRDFRSWDCRQYSTFEPLDTTSAHDREVDSTSRMADARRDAWKISATFAASSRSGSRAWPARRNDGMSRWAAKTSASRSVGADARKPASELCGSPPPSR